MSKYFTIIKLTPLIISLVTIIFLYNAYFIPLTYNKTFDSSDFVYNYNDLKNTSDSNSSVCFSYGPYETLKKGNYILNINYKSDSENKYKITGDKGLYIIQEGILPHTDKGISIPLKLYSNVYDEGFEFLTYYNGNGSFELNSLNIIRNDSIIPSLFMLTAYVVLTALLLYCISKENIKLIMSIFISVFYIFGGIVISSNIIAGIILFAFFILLIYKLNRIKKSADNDDLFVYLFLSVFSFFVMYFSTKSSPLYIINDWVDSQSYYTMGKGIFNGLAPYKDLFEQKGPLFYIIYGFAYLLSKNDFSGVYIIEAVFFAVTLIFVYKISRLFISKPGSVMSALIFPVFVLNAKIFRYGGSCEQLIMMFQLISIFYFIKYFSSENDLHSPKIMFIHGAAGACVLLMKFNTAIFWGGFGLLALIRILFEV